MLSHIKVLELASVLAGPSVGQFFAELGAEVIKVENVHTHGDVTRTWKSAGENTDDRSAYFCSVNWGKKSIAVDLNSEDGKLTVQKLALQSDIIVASYKRGDAEKLGVSYEQLKDINPRIIYGRITGYGSESDRVGYDAVVQAESGFMDLNGEKDGDPLKMPVALIDILAAHHLKEALLLALLRREKTNEGCLAEVSLIDSAITSLANQATNWLVAGKLPTRKGSLHPNIAPYGESFLTRDNKRILLAIGNDRQFTDLLRVLNIEEVIKDKRFISNPLRIQHRDALQTILAEAIFKVNCHELMKKIDVYKIPAGVIQNVQEVFKMKEAQQLLIKHKEMQGVINFAAHLSGVTKQTNLLPPPHFGEHTHEILKLLNIEPSKE